MAMRSNSAPLTVSYIPNVTCRNLSPRFIDFSSNSRFISGNGMRCRFSCSLGGTSATAADVLSSSVVNNAHVEFTAISLDIDADMVKNNTDNISYCYVAGKL